MSESHTRRSSRAVRRAHTLGTWRTLARFLTVGASGVIVNLGSFTLLLAVGVNRYVASPVAVEISILWNFLFHNYWTFRDRRTNDRVSVRGVKFNLVSVLTLLVSYGTFVGSSLLLPTLPPVVHQLLAIAPATLLNYLVNATWTFRDRGSTPERMGATAPGSDRSH